ncbi:hypothetical protein JCM10908_000261 [Rhodotorula pacifica]|uniref:uncharacterized protein n=1 Tax=Rhodotorula pacifica TaxID=1495444 RepID=UPI00316EF5A7
MRASSAGYIATAVLASSVEAWIGSLSEYRFPYPLTTTQIHLALSIGVVGTGIGIVQTYETLRGSGSGRNAIASETSGSTHRVEETKSAPKSSDEQLVARPPASTDGLASRIAVLLPWSVLIGIETFSQARVDPSFWSFVRLLPLLATLANNIASPKEPAQLYWWHMLLVSLLLKFWRSSPSTSHRDWLVGAAWVVASTSWVAALRRRFASEEKIVHEARTGRDVERALLFLQRLLRDLVSLAAVFSAAAALSSEWTAIMRYRHHGFFTEIGFWLQELGMALCGTVKLVAFYALVKNYEPIEVFAAVAAKDVLAPLVPQLVSGNPTDAGWNGDGVLTARNGCAALVALAEIAISGQIWEVATT